MSNLYIKAKKQIPNEFVFVSDKSDLPSAVSGVITLVSGYTYFFTTEVDLTGDRLVCGINTTILGTSSENSKIKSTGLVGTALITSNYSLPIRNIAIEANIALNLNGDGVTTALDWFGINFTNCPTIGTISNYSNFIMQDSGFLNSGGLTFSGTIGTIGFTQCLFDNYANTTAITISSGCTISRRFRIIYSSFVTSAGETSLNVSTSATIPTEGYILDTINFAGGGTYNTGVQYNDNKSLFVNCKGINNSAELANYYMLNNATVTNVISSATPLKIAGTTTANAVNQKFTHTNNRATYIGAIARSFKITSTISVTSTSANDQIGFYVAKNGVILPESELYITTNTNARAESIAIQTITPLTLNDYIEIWTENNSDASDVTVTYMNVIIESLN
jgi:hypothetical protein